MKGWMLSLVSLTFAAIAAAQLPNTPIPGWKMQENAGAYSFTPAMLFGKPNFHYDVYPLEKTGNTNLAGWLAARAAENVQASGYTPVPGQSSARDVQSFKTYSTLATDASGYKWLLNYMAYVLPDHSIRYARIIEIPNASVTKNNMNTAVQHFLKLSKQEGGLVAAAPANTGSTGNSTTTHQPSTKITTPVTAAGAGLKPDAIRGLVIHSESRIGVGGMMIIVYEPYLVLKDGTIYSYPDVSPYDLDVAQSRQVEEKRWGTWKLDSKVLTVTMNDDHKPETWNGGWFWADPAAKGEKLSGTWSTISGGGNTAMGGGAITYASNSLTFNNQGQFTKLSTGGGSFSGASGSVSAYSNKDAAGTYVLDGFGIELKYNNGTVVRSCFYFYPDSKVVWGINTRPYTTDDADKKNK